MKTARCNTCKHKNTNGAEYPCKDCALQFFNCYEREDNPELKIAERGALCIQQTYSFNCPYCGAEYQILDECNEFNDVHEALQNGASYQLHCDCCGHDFIVDSFKEYC